jgi:hypothetical protein
MPTNWDEQDSAFFGELHHDSKPSADEELAKRLQKQFLDEQEAGRLEEQKDREFAQKLNQHSQTSTGTGTRTTRSSYGNGNGNGERGRSIEDATGRSARNSSNGGLARGFFERNDKRRSDQQDKDAALARSMQEEEEKQFNSSSPRTRTRTRRHVGGPENYPGQRRGLGRLVPTCAVCNQMVLMPFTAFGNSYHAECFKCMGCHGNIGPNERFACTEEGEDGRKHPLHRQCYAEIYGLKCTVCHQIMQGDSSGRVTYKKHPFFDTEYMCPKHTEDSIRTCTGCFRFEPMDAPFANMNDANRCVCHSCLRSVIVDSDDAKPLWENVIQFLGNNLKLPIWPSMKQIPILIVGHDALNGQMGRHGHGGSSQIMTRGLCLSEHQRGSNFLLPRMRFDRKQSTFLPSDSQSEGYTYFQIPDASASNPNATVTAILCLSGLPADLTASILAHEATHAWIKLHPQYDVSRPIPPQVEEGCCQLVAMLFLTDGLAPMTQEKCDNGDGGPSDKRLRQYFKYAIETDSNEVYGEGYRKAALAYSKIGVEALLSHVVTYQEFPTV